MPLHQGEGEGWALPSVWDTEPQRETGVTPSGAEKRLNSLVFLQGITSLKDVRPSWEAFGTSAVQMRHRVRVQSICAKGAAGPRAGFVSAQTPQGREGWKLRSGTAAKAPQGVQQWSSFGGWNKMDFKVPSKSNHSINVLDGQTVTGQGERALN